MLATVSKKIEDILVVREIIPSYPLRTSVCKELSGTESGSGTCTWWKVQSNQISACGFIAMLSGGMVGWFCEPDMRCKDESETQTDVTKRRWLQFVHFPRIWLWNYDLCLELWQLSVQYLKIQVFLVSALLRISLTTSQTKSPQMFNFSFLVPTHLTSRYTANRKILLYIKACWIIAHKIITYHITKA